MNWIGYRVVFRLRSPLHIGWRKAGNVQVTRPYLTGRSFWGALTERLVRDRAATATQMATDSNGYQEVGKQVNEMLAFTYFYPALQSDNDYQVVWTWDDERTFRRRFLSSYQSTALVYPAHSAAEGSLHEIEFLSPHMLDTADPVYLVGYVFAHKDCSLPWRDALTRLRFGGERGYGWGDARLVGEPAPVTDGLLLFDKISFKTDEKRPVLALKENEAVLAHTFAQNATLSGQVEPMVGREWRGDKGSQKHIGQHLAYNGVCFAPGSRTQQPSQFILGEGGYWQMIPFEKERQP